MPEKIKTLALTSGDPNSISSFITLKSWSKLKDTNKKFFLIANAETVKRVINYFNFNIKLAKINTPEESDKIFASYLPVLDIETPEDFSLGKPSYRNGKYILKSLDIAIELANKKLIQGIVTNPIDKNLVNTYIQGKKDTINKFTGHTNYLSEKSNQKQTIMMMCTPSSNLKVVAITTHVSLKESICMINEDLLISQVRKTHKFFQERYKLLHPKFMLLGLNPHAGDNGLMGTEEIELIAPVIKKLQEEDIDITGPIPADSAFTHHNINKYDLIFGLYHDQVMIPFKTLHFDTGVNTTVGLDFVRTSPDHGVAFNLAKTNQASESSLLSAIDIAYKLI